MASEGAAGPAATVPDLNFGIRFGSPLAIETPRW
jgi:hypothetical protein